MSEWEDTCPDCLREADKENAMPSYTKEPWNLAEGKGITFFSKEGYVIGATMGGLIIRAPEADEANAARIVACVNGCAGLNPAAYKEVVEACRKMVARFQELPQDRSICVAPELCIMADALTIATKP